MRTYPAKPEPKESQRLDVRLPMDIISVLKDHAKKKNRDLKKQMEYILMEAAKNEPA